MRSGFKYITLSLIFLLFSFEIYKNINPKLPDNFPAPAYDLTKNPITEKGFELGRKLFYDPILSSDSTVSCANCHQQFSAFSNLAHPISHGVGGTAGTRNAPPLQNLIWNKSFMWDGGVTFLESQPLAPIINKLEMNETLEHVIQKLRRNKNYVSEFKNAFGIKTITTKYVAKALSQFMALMISSNSKYDIYLKGDVTFTASEQRGLKLFKEKCASCHTEPLFTDNGFRNNGLKPNPFGADSGRSIITANPRDLFLFKVPSLRNVAISAPYMHDGRFATLGQVLEHYSSEIYVSATTDSLLTKGISFSSTDRSDIISFLKTLTDRDFLYDKRFSDPTSTNNFLKDTHK